VAAGAEMVEDLGCAQGAWVDRDLVQTANEVAPAREAPQNQAVAVNRALIGAVGLASDRLPVDVSDHGAPVPRDRHLVPRAVGDRVWRRETQSEPRVVAVTLCCDFDLVAAGDPNPVRLVAAAARTD